MKKSILSLALPLALAGVTQLNAMDSSRYEEFVKGVVDNWAKGHARIIHNDVEKACKFRSVFQGEIKQADYRGSNIVELAYNEYATQHIQFTVKKANEFLEKFNQMYAKELAECSKK